MKTIIIFIAFFLVNSSNLFSVDDISHNHHTSLFLGMTSGLYEHAESNFTLGAEYEFYINSTKPIMGIGLNAEMIFTEHNEFLVGIPIFFHQGRSMKLFIMPGMLFSKQEVSTVEPSKTIERVLAVDEPSLENVNYFLIRFGGSWGFHMGNFSVTPNVALDIVEAKTYLVYGIAFGYIF